MPSGALWRKDIDALQFAAADHGGVCMIHRLAFRCLLGFEPRGDDCLAFFAGHAAAFAAAARRKAETGNIPAGRNFHLNSRDIRRQLGAATTV